MKNIFYRYQKIIALSPVASESLLASVGVNKRLRLAEYSPARQAESLSADVLARKLLESLYVSDSVMLEDDENGAPFFVGSDYSVSLSHSGEYAAAAVSLRKIGIDIEADRLISDSLIRRILSPEEQVWVYRQENASAAFLRLWTMREAYGKLNRIGIFTEQRFRAEFHGDMLCRDYPDCRFFFPLCPDGYTVSICTELPIDSDEEI